ncbi:hypothetical protein SDJN02_26758 [Cucurbita argyrosperma subsp. argyrosperma]|nr:hypothetical protein SDJN02_26758 [Cucurbita argyrosperma subsp. argyrosperma]
MLFSWLMEEVFDRASNFASGLGCFRQDITVVNNMLLLAEAALLSSKYVDNVIVIAKDAKLQKVPGKVMLVQDPRTPKSGGAAASALKLIREQGKAKIQERTRTAIQVIKYCLVFHFSTQHMDLHVLN